MNAMNVGAPKRYIKDLPSGPVAKTLSFQCWRPRVQSLGWEIPWKGKGYPLQDSGLENSMDCIVPGVAKSPT